MTQYQAGFILESTKVELLKYAMQNNCEAHLNGLLRSLSTFNVQPQVNLEIPSNIPSILAVATNIITRGLPTLASIKVEEYFSNALGLTKQFEDFEKGKISYSFSELKEGDNYGKSFYNGLHAIDPRAKNRHHFLDISDTDSNFEKSFLLRLIPENQVFLTQLLEKQRTRSSFTRDNNYGRVDFSLEIPYDLVREDLNRYKQKVKLKHLKTFIIEVDGTKYHSDLLDDLKDFEVSQLSTTVKHISEISAYQNVEELLTSLLSEEFVKLAEANFRDDTFLNDPLSALVLSPFGIARLQRVFLEYYISNYDLVSTKEDLKIAVIERDFPCARVAFDDLFDLLSTLNDLTQTQIAIPKNELEVFSSDEFLNHPLHRGTIVKPIVDFNPNNFDLVLDISLLRRESIFKEDRNLANNVISIRNAHYVHYKTITGVYSAPPIAYRPLVTQLQNEVYEPIEETSMLLRKVLRDIFRKLDFRPGQLPILNRAMQQKSVIGLLPTGGGKSLTYQMAAMLQPGTTIVIDPIRSLMIDQYSGLREIGIDKCEFINSTLSTSERNYNQHQLLAKGQLQFLFVSPERFVIDEFRKALDNAAKDKHYFSYAVIDEVHCVSEWGHDFRTPYLNLGDNAQEFCHTYNGGPIPLFGLTATASFDVLADIERELNIKEDDGNAVVRFENSVRDEINYIIKEVPNTYEGLNNLTEQAIRESIGAKKQEAIFDFIADKDGTLRTFNNKEAINAIVKHSYQNYVPVSVRQKLLKKAGSEEEAFKNYVSLLHNRLQIYQNPFLINQEGDKKLYKYGIIVFMPHRQGWLGIRNGYNSHGVFDKPSYVTIEHQDKTEFHYNNDETLGYFMGSGDDENAANIDKESFHHLEKFKDNEESVMVATKAFGMGIDKPNVRMTIHINIPQSIESFVQEAGRAGRDGKLSASVILYNNDLLALPNTKKEPYHLDKDVLMYFHKNSFKGQVKERVMIHELRSKITFPNTTNLQMLTNQLNDLFGSDQEQFIIKPGGANHQSRIFINTVSGKSIGFVHLDTQHTGIYRDFGDDAFCYQLVEWLKSSLPFEKLTGITAIRDWLTQVVVNTNHQMGLERLFAEMKDGESKELPVPFTNSFYSKRERSKQFFNLNQEYLNKVLQTQAIKQLINTSGLSQIIITSRLKDSVFDNLDYTDFIESLNINNESLLKQLLTLDDSLSLELQRAYFLPRNQEDTAKAIYRLVSIGIIDSYTIDYQNKLYNITFTKKPEKEYFKSLEELVARYTSRNVAKKEISVLKKAAKKEIEAGTATVISKCLEYLTDFIYGKIKEKRLQAIDDMVRLCQNSIQIKDPLKQNEFVKDEIYYYFNAKYSRRKFIERTRSGEIEASMPDDMDDDLAIDKSIDKYISLVENEETGEFISNIKHLRGSSMRMLRSNPEKPQFRILKSFSLFILGDSIAELIKEAKEELVRGLIDWKHNEDPSLSVPAFIILFKKQILNHVNYDVEMVFDDIEDQYYVRYYDSWLQKFDKQFTLSQK